MPTLFMRTHFVHFCVIVLCEGTWILLSVERLLHQPGLDFVLFYLFDFNFQIFLLLTESM